MIADLELWEDPPDLHCDVCVVGAGAAGLALGRAFSGGPLSVVILESGGESVEPATQSLCDAFVTGLPYAGYRHGRVRVLGGTTTKWGGQALPLTRFDFERRDWVPYSGWPFSHAELTPYYARAAEFFGIDSSDFRAGTAATLGVRLPAFDPTQLLPYFSKWCPEPDMARRHANALRVAPNVRIVLHANVTSLLLGDGSRVTEIGASSLGGRAISVFPRTVVLACGGLETPRLLLANRSQCPSGLGNEHDLVGRFLQDHPGGVLGLVTPGNDSEVQKTFNVFHRRGIRYTLRFGLSPDLQRRERTLGASGSLMFVAREGSSFAAAKAIYRGFRLGPLPATSVSDFFRIIPSVPALARAVVARAGGRTHTPDPEVRLIGSFEQQPDRESRVVLARDADRLGVPRLDIRWRLDESLLRTSRTFAFTAKRELESLGVGNVQLAPWLLNDEEDWRLRLGDHYHHIGTTRMDPSPREGVVDANGRVHSSENLYVASSAVFPMGGHSNPTMTIIALAFRLADRLLILLGHR